MTQSRLPTSIPLADCTGRGWLRTPAALALALGLVVATSAQAGDCGTVAPFAEAPAWVDDRAVTSAALVPMPEATDSAEPADVATTARPTGPEVRPCRHLPREQMIECLRTTAAG